MMLLSGVKSADFNFLRGTLSLTNGNLSSHMNQLEQAGYVAVTKTFEGKTPRTTYGLTRLGKSRLAEYWQVIDEIRSTAAS